MLIIMTASRLLANPLGAAALVFVIMLGFYEGAPLGPLRWVPYLGPTLEQLVDGRVDRERRAAALAERLAWQEAQRMAEAEHARRLREAQAKADAAELAYLTEKALRESDARTARAELEAALKKSEADNVSSDGCTPCRTFSRGVSRALDQVGR